MDNKRCKAKRLDNHEWVEGWYVGKTCDFMFAPARDSAQIIDDNLMWHEVDPETVSHYIGKTDAEGYDVCEGDILRDPDGDENGVVEWDNDLAAYRLIFDNCSITAENADEYFVIGNKHDNPDLITRSDRPDPPDVCVVRIPMCENHEGLYGAKVRLRWVCPICGKPRGEIKEGKSYDGSLPLSVDTWENPCGHVDKYADVLKEAATNGLNPAPTEVKHG